MSVPISGITPSTKSITVHWPRYDIWTKGGKMSNAKGAGKYIPWLSANVVNNLAKPVYRQAKALWRDQAEWAGDRARGNDMEPLRLTGRYILDITLYRLTSQAMDPFAILEGVKPIIDGFVCAQVIPEDTEQYIAGAVARCRKSPSKGDCRVVIRWVEV